jgi:hypothetical protein
MIFLVPGSHANAARHFLCQAPANRVDGEMAAHAVGSSSPSFALSQAEGTRFNRPNWTVLMSPRAAAS